MAYDEPARTIYRRRRPTVLAAILALALLALPVVAARHFRAASDHSLAETARRAGGDARTLLPSERWPPRGQAAIVLGDGRPAVSPHQGPAPIASLAKVMTAYLTLERHPLAGGEAGFTITVTAAQARRRTAVGVVMGQGEGSDTSTLLAAAGEAAERLVGAAVTASGGGAFRPRIENRIRAGNTPPPKLEAMTYGEPAKKPR